MRQHIPCNSRTDRVIQAMSIFLTALLASSMAMAEIVADFGPISKSASQQIRPGQVVWADLLTNDVSSAVDFYVKVFGWDVQFNKDKSYAYATIDGSPVAAIAAYDENESADAEGMWLLSISVKDVNATAKAVMKAGGKILEGPEELPGRGQYILIEDTRGALIMFLRATGGDPQDNSGDDSDWLWAEMWTDDTAASTRFYEEVLGYRSVAIKGTTGKEYQVMGRDQKPRASVVESPFPEISPNWLPYVKVDDVDMVAMDVIKHGGSVLVPPQRDDLDYHVAIVADPTGGVFAIQEMGGEQ